MISKWAQFQMFEVFKGAWVSLHTDTPDLQGSNEVSGGLYARAPFGAEFKDSELVNAATVDFNFLPDVAVSHVAFWDKPSLGNLLATLPLFATVHAESGDGITFAKGQLSVKIFDA